MNAKATAQDEYYVRSDLLRTFIHEVQEIIARSASPAQAVAALRTPFSRLLADRAWLPEEFRKSSDRSRMGAGVGNWLLYRAGDRSLTLSVLVLPSGATTPVHDHLAWGLVGLYDGAQEERVYRRVRNLSKDHADHAELELAVTRRLQGGDFYELLPPEDDIHSVTTTSSTSSISLHLLTTDLGCIWRHAYDPTQSTVKPFRSNYTNVDCEDEKGAARRK